MAFAAPARAVPIGDLPGEDVQSSGGDIANPAAPPAEAAPAPTDASSSWLAPPVQDQLSRDATLIPLGKGAVFIPTFSEPRREPEVSAFYPGGKLAKSGQAGVRILLDSGSYVLRVGSGTVGQQIPVDVLVQEGHTTVVQPNWGGLLVETLDVDGNYFEGQYEVIRMGKWINYGKGHGLPEERLQDIKLWVLPPGEYRISKPGEAFNSLRDYITVQINAGELSQVELIYDKQSGGDVVAGGIKSLDTHIKVGGNWSFGVRAGGNLNLTRQTDQSGIRAEAMQVASDLRARAVFDNVRYLGTNEILLQDNFGKQRNKPFSVTLDRAQVRTTWIRRLLPWLGPYLRGTVDTHLFPQQAPTDTFSLQIADASGTRVVKDSIPDFVVEPEFDPVTFVEGAGVNAEFISQYYLEASAQMGIAAHQTLADASYALNPQSVYVKSNSVYEIGPEAILNATLRLGSQMTLDLRIEAFAPDADASRTRLNDLSADFRFFLSRNVEVGYLYELSEVQGNVKNRFPSSHDISLRLSFNY